MLISELLEAVTDNWLYHGTSPRNASKILRMNLMVARTKQLFGRWRGRFKDKHVDIGSGDDVVMGVSFTRDIRFARDWTTGKGSGSMANQQGVPGVIFVIDAAKLRTRHRIVPTEYLQHSGKSMDRSEREEFVPGDIKNFSSYVKEILVPSVTAEWMKKNNSWNDYTELLNSPKMRVI